VGRFSCVGRSLVAWSAPLFGAVPCGSVPCGSLPLPCSSFPHRHLLAGCLPRVHSCTRSQGNTAPVQRTHYLSSTAQRDLQRHKRALAPGLNSNSSRASVLETLLTAQTRLVLQTAAYRRQKRKKHADRHENVDARKWRLEHRAGWG